MECFQGLYIYIYIYIYIRGAFNRFPDFFVQAFRIIVDSWKFIMLLLYILWDDWPIFIISASNEQLQQQLEYTLQKPDCHSWWISKMQSEREGKCHRNAWKAGKIFCGILHESSISFWVADSRKAGSLWGMMRDVEGVRKSIHQSWLAKVLGLGLLCWSFKGVQVEIPSEEARTIQIVAVAFPPGQCTSPQLYPCQTIWARWASKQLLTLPIVQTLLSVTFAYSLSSETIEKMKEAVTKVIDTLTQEDVHGAFQKLLERYTKCIAAGGDYFKGD